MKLYEVPNDTKIVVPIKGVDYELMFYHIDGMYSYCTDIEGNVVHLSAWTEVNIKEEIQ